MLSLTTAALILIVPPVVTLIGVSQLLRVERHHTIMRMRRRRDRQNWMRRHREFMRRFEPSVN